MLSVSQTCRLQGRSLFAYLTATNAVIGAPIAVGKKPVGVAIIARRG